MQPNLTAIERAFQLAKSGGVESVEDIRRALAKEGYSVEYVQGRSVRHQLNGLIRDGITAAKPRRAKPTPSKFARNAE
jgi:hypothetical protein